MNLASINLVAVARKAAIFVLAYAAYVAVGTVIHGYLRGAALNSASHTYSAGPAEQALFHGMPVEWLGRCRGRRSWPSSLRRRSTSRSVTPPDVTALRRADERHRIPHRVGVRRNGVVARKGQRVDVVRL